MSLKARLKFDREPVYLMDGNAFIYRGFFANPNMNRSDGMPTGAIYIVGRILLKLLKEERPVRFAFIQDGKGPNFRHEIYSDYKANRPPTPEELRAQFTPITKIIKALGLHLEISEGCEADDCIASLAKRFQTEAPVVIVGMDKDLRQCLTENVIMWDPASREEKVLTLQSFQDETGLEPSQWPDVQALIGDSSDNIPGVRGIGPKTAEKLFQDFKNLEDIRARIAEISLPIQKKLDGNLESMFLYRELTTLRCDQCKHVKFDDLKLKPVNAGEALTLFKEFEMNSLHRELKEMLQHGIITAQDGPELRAVDPEAGITRQFSLLDSIAKPDSSPDLPWLESIANLPDCADKIIALTPLPVAMQSRDAACEGLAIAVSGTILGEKPFQAWYKGPMANLAKYAAAAKTVVCPDYKHLLREDAAWSAIAPGKLFDLSLAAYLLDPEDRDYSWPRLSARHAEQSGLPQSRPATLALSQHQKLDNRLAEAGLEKLLREIEQPLSPVLAGMEQAGIKVDLQALQIFLDEVQTDLDRLTSSIYKAAGGEFNLRSAQQIGEVLYKRLQLPMAKSTRGGQASTAQDVLEKLSGKHLVVDNLLEFRKLEKLRSTYLEPLPRQTGKDGRIHTTFNQTATATGRLSSSNPNLQNIPIRGDLGRRMRTCFTADPGNCLISADYSQIELRVLAHYSQDPTLLQAFRNGEDIHARTAALLNEKNVADITPDQRRSAKTINFGLIYGMGARKLANDLGFSQTEAKEFIARYFARFSKIKNFYDEVEKQARLQGFVTTLSGRRRPLPDINSQNDQARALAERQAVNTLIQGSAADIIKLAMLAVYNDKQLHSLNAKLLLQVHDELVLEAPEANAQQAGMRLNALMGKLQGISLAVPLAADWGYGPNWGSAH